MPSTPSPPRKKAVFSANDSYVAKFLTYKLSEIHPSDVTQYRLMPPLPLTPDAMNKYPAESAKTFMREVANVGFGLIKQCHNGKRSTISFRKHKFDELGDAQVETLQKLKIACKDYDLAFRETTPYIPAPEDESTSTDGSMDSFRDVTSE